MNPPGRFITFEGVEGCGKTTQLARIATALATAGVAVVTTREPGGTDLGARLRRALLAPTSKPMSSTTELLLYAADRAQHLEEVVLPALAEGAIVLCDRYLDATLAYQGFARGLGVERVLELHRCPPLDTRPLRTVLVDLDPAVALERARGRERGLEASQDRFEREPDDFHRRVRDGYLELARREPDRFRVVDGAGDAERVAARVRTALDDVLPELAR